MAYFGTNRAKKVLVAFQELGQSIVGTDLERMQGELRTARTELGQTKQEEQTARTQLEQTRQDVSRAEGQKRTLEADVRQLQAEKERLSRERDSLLEQGRTGYRAVLAEEEQQARTEMQVRIEQVRQREETALQAQMTKRRAEIDSQLGQVQISTAQETTRLNAQIAELKAEVKRLTGARKSEKQMIADYQRQISSMFSGNVSGGQKTEKKTVVKWEKVGDDHTIMACNYQDIESYVSNLKKVFAKKTGHSLEDTELEIAEHAPNLYALVNAVKQLNNKFDSDMNSIRRIIKCSNWHSKDRINAYQVKNIIQNLELPVYEEREVTVDQPQAIPTFNPQMYQLNNIPTNTQDLLTMLGFQQIAMEQSAKARILEAQLGLVMQMVPPDVARNINGVLSNQAMSALRNREQYGALGAVVSSLENARSVENFGAQHFAEVDETYNPNGGGPDGR